MYIYIYSYKINLPAELRHLRDLCEPSGRFAADPLTGLFLLPISSRLPSGPPAGRTA